MRAQTTAQQPTDRDPWAIARKCAVRGHADADHRASWRFKWASDARLDLLTIDGAPGGTGMSPWRMMEEWGIPTFYLQCMATELADVLAKKGKFVPDLAMGGGFSTEDHLFKVLAMGAPHFKAVCMGRALMIPGMVGKNIGLWLKDNNLPKGVSEFGATKEEIFIGYESLVDKYGKEEADQMPLGAIGMFCFGDKLQTGLQQLMAGSRNFSLSAIGRSDLTALTEEAAKISGIPYVMNAYRDEAMKIIEA